MRVVASRRRLPRARSSTRSTAPSDGGERATIADPQADRRGSSGDRPRTGRGRRRFRWCHRWASKAEFGVPTRVRRPSRRSGSRAWTIPNGFRRSAPPYVPGTRRSVSIVGFRLRFRGRFETPIDAPRIAVRIRTAVACSFGIEIENRHSGALEPASICSRRPTRLTLGSGSRLGWRTDKLHFAISNVVWSPRGRSAAVEPSRRRNGSPTIIMALVVGTPV